MEKMKVKYTGPKAHITVPTPPDVKHKLSVHEYVTFQHNQTVEMDADDAQTLCKIDSNFRLLKSDAEKLNINKPQYPTTKSGMKVPLVEKSDAEKGVA